MSNNSEVSSNDFPSFNEVKTLIKVSFNFNLLLKSGSFSSSEFSASFSFLSGFFSITLFSLFFFSVILEVLMIFALSSVLLVFFDALVILKLFTLMKGDSPSLSNSMLDKTFLRLSISSLPSKPPKIIK